MRRVNTLPKALSLSRTIYVGARSPGKASVIWHAQPLRHRCRVTAKAQGDPTPHPWPRIKKCEELLKGNRRDYKKITGRAVPSAWLRRKVFHVCDGRPRLGTMYFETVDWATSKPSFRKFAVDVRRTPERVLEAHSSDKVAHLFVDLRSATERAGFPSPECSEAFAMPTHDRLRP